ncbi:hypothetical protein EV368DRAFT_84223 [Lentinula lateritia]|nr:hypothetical protein EV368DRAFT_84223 [Lentinula lateritia]
MPSLRRTVSSPAVRSSPYPTLSSSGQLSSGPATRSGYSHRRPSDSEITTRRVLADIEWWRVTDGQRDLETEQHGHEQSPPRTAENPMDMLEGLISPLWLGFSEDLPELSSIVLQTPPRRGHRHESSSSSVQSTSETSEGAVEDLRLGLQYMDLSASDVILPPVHSNERATAFTYSPFSRSRSFVSASDIPRYDYSDFAGLPFSSQSPDIFD